MTCLLEKINWFCLTGLITLVLLMWKWMGPVIEEKLSSKMQGVDFLLNWIEVLTLSLLLKMLPRKFEP